jgi:hypothetical protein
MISFPDIYHRGLFKICLYGFMIDPKLTLIDQFGVLNPNLSVDLDFDNITWTLHRNQCSPTPMVGVVNMYTSAYIKAKTLLPWPMGQIPHF